MKYLLASLLVINLDFAFTHSSHHSSHTSSHTSHISSYSNYKPYKINKIVPASLFTLFVFNDFTNAIKNDFEKNRIYKVFNISKIIINNEEDCIYYNTYVNKYNETSIISLDNIIANSSNNLYYLHKYCRKKINNTDIWFNIFYIILFIIFICICCDSCCDTQPSYNRSSNMY